MIEVTNLTKRYGSHAAVDDLSFSVKPGVVTGFLGPNGAGKSTTMRVILGLDRPTVGRALVNGRPFEEHRAPLREVGALLDAKGIHPARSARDHLSAIAATTGISKRRVAEVLALVGLSEVADHRWARLVTTKGRTEASRRRMPYGYLTTQTPEERD